MVALLLTDVENLHFFLFFFATLKINVGFPTYVASA